MVDEPQSRLPLIIEKPNKNLHNRRGFDCGEPELNDYLMFIARQHVDKGFAQVWVAASESGSADIIGYYTLSMTSLEPINALENIGIKKIPALLLGKLAVDQKYKGQRIGERLLMHAQRCALLLAREVGIHALVVDALHENAADFYRKYDFMELTKDGLRYYKTLADIRKMGLL
ncbi:MAG: GNAT family N-acetyltransferase [Armatimonadota bacterium]